MVLKSFFLGCLKKFANFPNVSFPPTSEAEKQIKKTQRKYNRICVSVYNPQGSVPSGVKSSEINQLDRGSGAHLHTDIGRG